MFTDWLMDSAIPSIHYFTLRHLEGKPETDTQVQAIREAMHSTGPIPVIFRAKQAITASIVAALLTTAANNALNLDASHWQYALLDSTLFLMTFIASLALMKCFGRRRLDILVDIIALQSRSKR